MGNTKQLHMVNVTFPENIQSVKDMVLYALNQEQPTLRLGFTFPDKNYSTIRSCVVNQITLGLIHNNDKGMMSLTSIGQATLEEALAKTKKMKLKRAEIIKVFLDNPGKPLTSLELKYALKLQTCRNSATAGNVVINMLTSLTHSDILLKEYNKKGKPIYSLTTPRPTEDIVFKKKKHMISTKELKILTSRINFLSVFKNRAGNFHKDWEGENT